MRTLMRTHSCHTVTAVAVLVLLTAGRAAAQETILHYTTDAIGSVRMVTDSGGAVVARYDYRPFGDPCGTACGPQSSTERQQFAGSEKDTETTLDYFGARHYSNGIGRFLSADLPGVDQYLGDPQSWGLYSYTRNNPLRFVDPTGRECTPSGYEATYRVCVTPPSPHPIGDWLYGMLSGFLDSSPISTSLSNSDLGHENLPHRDSTPAETLGGVLSPRMHASKAGRAMAVSSGRLLYRYRSGTESVARLARGAADAAAKIGVHGVSVTTNPITGRPCGVACREAVQRVFPVVKTGSDPNHFTVVLPNPVTREVADKFNALFRTVP